MPPPPRGEEEGSVYSWVLTRPALVTLSWQRSALVAEDSRGTHAKILGLGT
jgi:hypothetical protein